jgi:adenine/guanine phosphoribosyltransferase-like PRPP-binding protein
MPPIVSMERQKRVMMQTYTVEVAGEPVTLPIVPINDTLAISLLMVIDMGVRFGERIGKAMAAKLAPLKPGIVVGAATLGIPVVIEVSRALGLDQYVIAQKSPKIHLADALVEELQSVTSSGKQRLMLDRRAVPLLAGRRVVVVDDVVATGSSLAATFVLARKAGAEIVGAGVILTEGHGWKKTLGADAQLVQGLGHIPQFALANGKAAPMPETL